MQAFCVKLNLQSGKCAAVLLGVSIVVHSIIMITKHSQDSKASEFWGTPQMQSHADLHQYTSLKFRVGCHFWIISRKHDIKLQNMQNLIVTVESKKKVKIGFVLTAYIFFQNVSLLFFWHCHTQRSQLGTSAYVT